MNRDLPTLMSATEIATLFLDRDLRILRFTPRVATLLDVRRSDRGRPVGDLTHRFGVHDLVRDARHVLEQLVAVERELVTEGGECILTRVHPYRSADDRIDGVVITFVGVTEHKEAERRVREVNARLEDLVAERTEQLRHANDELEAFNHSVSHDLRAPLRGIERFTRSVLDEHGATVAPSAHEMLERVLQGAQRMTELIDGLHELSSIGRTELRHETVDLTTIAEDLVVELRAREPDRRVAVHIDPNLIAHGDERLLRVVLVNLLDNAWKFTRHEPDARIELRGGTATSSSECTFTVGDNGAGFDTRVAARLFTPFKRLHPTEAFEGTGIGLALVRRILSRHGGTITATGEVGRGATFTFSLPDGAEDDAANPLPEG